MKTKKIVALFVLVLVSLVGANTASAVVVEDFVANGAQGPLSQGWASAGGVDASAHIAASGGDPIAWQQSDTNSSGGYRINDANHPSYKTVMDGADGWTATIETKLLSCGRRCAAFRLQTGASRSKFELNFWDGTDFGDGDPGAFYTAVGDNYWAGQRLGAAFGTSGDIDPTDGFHKYQISMDAKGTDYDTNSTDDEISIFVDDVLVVGPLPRTAFPTGGEYEFLIGRGEAGTYTHTIQYANFAVESGSIVIPEPSALVLLTLGLLGLLGYRRRR